MNTAITEQEGIKISTSSQNSIIQKISNFVSTGDDNISFKKSMDKLNKRQLEEIGTERSSQKPINIVNNKIYKILEEKRNLETYKDSIYDNSIEKEQLKLEEQDEMIKKELLNEIRLKLDNNRVKSAEINFNKNLENDYVQKIKELNYKVCNDKAEESLEEVHSKNYYILILVFIIAFIILMIFNPYKLINFVILLPVIYILYRKNKEEKKIKEKFKNRNIEKEKIINEIEVLNRNKKEQLSLFIYIFSLMKRKKKSFQLN